MTQINLLPWREELRDLKKRQFLQILSISITSIILLSLVLYYQLQNRNTQQQRHNVAAQHQLAQLASRVTEAKNLQNQIQLLAVRLQVINKAHDESIKYVRLLNELARAIPRGVLLTELYFGDNEFVLNGLAEANANISIFSRHLGAIKSVRHTKLAEIKVVQEGGLYRYGFTIKAGLL